VGFEIAFRLAQGVDRTKISVHPFDGFIFLCGGAISSSEATIASARHYALSRVDAEGRIAGRTVILAEKLTNLLHGDDFRDLLEFEEHIAALSACVLLFVESPGSIAELGSFAVMPHLAPRLLVVCEQLFDVEENPSFIFLGPIASLRRKRMESVQVFPLFNANVADKDMLDDCWEYIEEAVLGSLRRPVTEALLDAKELSHQMLTVATVVNLCVGVRIGEIEECASALGLALSPKELRRILRMLEQFSLVRSRTYGNDRFYFSLLEQPLMTLRPPAGDRGLVLDPVRFKASAIEFYQESDPRKARAIKAFVKERAK